MKTQVLNLDDRLLKKREVAEKLSCSPRTVDRLADSGHLKRVKCAGVRFRASEVQAIINGGGL